MINEDAAPPGTLIALVDPSRQPPNTYDVYLLGSVDENGNYTILGQSPDCRSILVKKPARPENGAYRDFQSEFGVAAGDIYKLEIRRPRSIDDEKYDITISD